MRDIDDSELTRLLDKNHNEVLDALPEDHYDLSDIQTRRLAIETAVRSRPSLIDETPARVTAEDHLISRDREDSHLTLRVYRPTGLVHPAPALLWMHGGGFVLGSIDLSDADCRLMATSAACLVVSVDYRLAPENPYPAAIEDCYSALRWVFQNAEQLGVDAQRVAAGGSSAGGGLAASLALMSRDRGQYELAFQFLIYPMLDDRGEAASARRITATRVWNSAANQIAWNALLTGAAGGRCVSPYAAAARAEDLSGLPPAYISVGDLDLFADENIQYARRLIDAGIPTDLRVYAGLIHGSDTLLPGSRDAMAWVRERTDVLRRALESSRRHSASSS